MEFFFFLIAAGANRQVYLMDPLFYGGKKVSFLTLNVTQIDPLKTDWKKIYIYFLQKKLNFKNNIIFLLDKRNRKVIINYTLSEGVRV